jgi:hypothetical protein
MTLSKPLHSMTEMDPVPETMLMLNLPKEGQWFRTGLTLVYYMRAYALISFRSA